jgi:hypothetical protein
MGNNTSIERYIVLFLPWLLALLFKSDPKLSYMIAWLGSILILCLTLTGWVKPLPDDRSIAEQLMRPVFLVQIIFAGYMSCTSIFYFFDVLGYVDFSKANDFYLIDQERLRLTAECQRYYCLGHAAFITGILVFMRYPIEHKYYYNPAILANLFLVMALITLPVSVLFIRIPGLSQFSNQFSSLSFISGTLALAFAIPQKKPWHTLVCVLLYGSNFLQALTSGFKEPIIVSVLILGIFLYPNYKKVVTFTFIPILLALFMFLPTYNRIFRQNAWGGNLDTEEASQLALDAALNQDDDADDGNWAFFAYRLSEIDMFTKFVQSTPTYIDYYNFELLKQSAIAVIPRIFWPSKPITEDMIMERVYKAGVVYRASKVSAKPAVIVDAYLSGGTFGVFALLFIYGAVCQLIANKAEMLFGGYTLGVALVFTGLFQTFWRGLSLEFLVNTIFWSYVTMWILFRILRGTKILQRI